MLGLQPVLFWPCSTEPCRQGSTFPRQESPLVGPHKAAGPGRRPQDAGGDDRYASAAGECFSDASGGHAAAEIASLQADLQAARRGSRLQQELPVAALPPSVFDAIRIADANCESAAALGVSSLDARLNTRA